MAVSIKQRIAEDILRVASRYSNNVLYPENYWKFGHFTEKDIKRQFHSLKLAFRELHIVNPYDPYDLDAVLNDMKELLKEHKTLSRTLYEEYGIYDVDTVELTHGLFNDLMARIIKKKPAPVHHYPKHKILAAGRHALLIWHKPERKKVNNG